MLFNPFVPNVRFFEHLDRDLWVEVAKHRRLYRARNAVQKERGDQGLSIGGNHDAVRCVERRQIAKQILFFLSKKITFLKTAQGLMG